VKGWAELKEAFWAVLDGGPSERERRTAELRAIDPALPDMLDALLAADSRGEPLMPLEDPEAAASPAPTRIGDYDVVALLGAGAMGEVYRARDARLGRDVAIKVLRTSTAGDPDRLARFEREARVLASLNHPRVAHVYGLESVDGSPALVMELVEGPTLTELTRRDGAARPAVPRALHLAAQIADGLSAAHERGIIHRDLKPGNIALTAAGDIKVLDFGIAKRLTEADSAGDPAGTVAGTMLGTPAYMSPEQARGEPCDQRADIWAFGCVLVELLTGRSPFARPSTSESLAAVLEHTPDLSALPRDTPASVQALIRHCLEKDPQRRLRDIADARLIIEDAIGGAVDVSGRRRTVSVPLWIALALGFAAMLMAVAAWLARDAPAAPARVISTLVLPAGLRLGGTDLPARYAESHFAVSPDGRRMAVVAIEATGQSRLWIRELASDVFHPLAGTEGGYAPFWSPDSTMLGFLSEGRLRTIPAAGGTPLTLSPTAFMRGSWNRDGQILFAPAARSPLHSVAATGGQSRPVTHLDAASGEVQHSEPEFLPDGRRFLYFSHGTAAGGALDSRGVFVGSLDPSETPRLLVSGVRQARYAAGQLLFVRDGVLMAQPFDPDRLLLSGAARPIVEELTSMSTGATGPTAAYSVSDGGVLAYQAALWTQSRIVVVDRDGREVAGLGASGDIGDVAASRDGDMVAVSMIDPAKGTRDLWVYPTGGGPGRRVTFEPTDEFAPVWSPDGARLLFSAMRDGLVQLAVVEVNGTASPRPFETDREGIGRFAADWSRDDRAILYVAGGRAIVRSDLFMAPPAAPGEARALLSSAYVETQGRIAPGGGWMVYTSNETGRLEVYVDRFPALGDKRRASVDGGAWPRWSADGRVLYLVTPGGDLMMAQARATGDRLEISAPRRLFPLAARAPGRLDAYAYDVLPDGRFVVNRLPAEPGTSAITIVLNWTSSTPGR
jgi:Tol biopolymer transport system component